MAYGSSLSVKDGAKHSSICFHEHFIETYQRFFSVKTKLPNYSLSRSLRLRVRTFKEHIEKERKRESKKNPIWRQKC